jgi:hypothetical protein
MGEAIKTTHCEICGELTHMLGTKLCDNCWELQNRLMYAMGSEKVRVWLVERIMTGSMGNAILDMDDFAWSDGGGVDETQARADAWETLVDAAEKVTGRQSHHHDWEKRDKKKILDNVRLT